MLYDAGSNFMVSRSLIRVKDLVAKLEIFPQLISNEVSDCIPNIWCRGVVIIITA